MMTRVWFTAILWAAFVSAVNAADKPPMLTNSIGMKLVRLPAGEFEMGLDRREELRLAHPNSVEVGENERPSFPVKLTQPFEIAAHEVTVGQFRRFVEATGYKTDAEKQGGAYTLHAQVKNEVDRFRPEPKHNWRNPGFEQADNHPVTCVSWQDALAFCRWLSKKEGHVYRLPTEAEWEYACRAGKQTFYACGDDPDAVYQYGNVADAALYAKHPDVVIRQRVVKLKEGEGDGHVYTSPVASFQPNAWGLYDMHGNVWEWCSDKYHDRYYTELLKIGREKGSRNKPVPTVDPQGPETTPQHEHGDWRSIRGGSWYVSPISCRSSVRAYAEGSEGFSYLGFRVVREVADK